MPAQSLDGLAPPVSMLWNCLPKFVDRIFSAFERDLRLYADKVKGMKFDSGGLWYRATSKEIFVKSEEEIFEILGLEYIRRPCVLSNMYRELNMWVFRSSGMAKL
jgi:hypothetical protein